MSTVAANAAIVIATGAGRGEPTVTITTGDWLARSQASRGSADSTRPWRPVPSRLASTSTRNVPSAPVVALPTRRLPSPAAVTVTLATPTPSASTTRPRRRIVAS